MINFKPFKGIHAKEENFKDFPIYSLNIYTDEQIRLKLRGKTHSYIDLIKPIFFKGESPLENRLKKVRKRYEDYIKENLLELDPASFYIYEQKKKSGETYKGILGLLSVEDFEGKNIKVPSFSNETKVKDFTQFLDLTYLQTNPILLCYESNSKIELLMDLEMKSKSFIQFEDEMEISHRLWRIDNRLKLAQFKEVVSNLPSLYLADGYYRLMGAIKHSDKIKDKSKSKNFLLDQNHQVLSLLVSGQNLKIIEYNRLLKSLNGLSKKDVFTKLEQYFTINYKGNDPYFPSHKHHISMYIDGEFFGLYIKHEFRGMSEGLGNIDTYLFKKFILDKIFNIMDSEEEMKLVSYIKGSNDIEGIKKMKHEVDMGEFKIGFGFYPPSFSDLQKVLELGEKLPEKITYIEPKFPTGIIMLDMK
ncbi:Uncharacterized conserved protein, DUF1015 family [Apibacter mensalis]|uniref:Uncharacterized conserved protein, DUF1015 family n=1 Tax=Apibacter mensalis TaxID=1586267 RepID=A0A0X3AM72_9FLAO|nr:DUF1015 domain-containing protein [Apibacter mensalis]CVK15472.1 Uncharacterized conserved protein, DUF1015 family [Apibacter mensalis]